MKNRPPHFIMLDTCLLPASQVQRIDTTRLEDGVLTVTAADGQDYIATQFNAFDIMMTLKPAVMEGRRLRWDKNAWAFHNLVAHPLMQMLVWCGLSKLGIRLHDATVPKPVGLRTLNR